MKETFVYIVHNFCSFYWCTLSKYTLVNHDIYSHKLHIFFCPGPFFYHEHEMKNISEIYWKDWFVDMGFLWKIPKNYIENSMLQICIYDIQNSLENESMAEFFAGHFDR